MLEKVLHAAEERLRGFLDEREMTFILSLVREHPCIIRTVRARRTKHGDHRVRGPGALGEITVNVSGNRYQFLITLIHEIAHAAVHHSWGVRAAAHGREWRQTFGNFLKRALEADLFPPDLAPMIERQSRRPDASSSRDTALQLALRQHDTADHRPMVEELAFGTWFSLDGKLILRRGIKLRSRFACESSKGLKYRVSATARVQVVYQSPP